MADLAPDVADLAPDVAAVAPDVADVIAKITRIPKEYGLDICKVLSIAEYDALAKFIARFKIIKYSVRDQIPLIKFGFCAEIEAVDSIFGKGSYVFAESLDVANDRIFKKSVPGAVRSLKLCAIVMSEFKYYGSPKILPDIVLAGRESKSFCMFTCTRGFEFCVFNIEQIIPLFQVDYIIKNFEAERLAPKTVPWRSDINILIPEMHLIYKTFYKYCKTQEHILLLNEKFKGLLNYSIQVKDFIQIMHDEFNSDLASDEVISAFEACVNKQSYHDNTRNDNIGKKFMFSNYYIKKKIFDDVILPEDKAECTTFLTYLLMRNVECKLRPSDFKELVN